MAGLSLSVLLGFLPPDNKLYFGPAFLDHLKEALVKLSSLLDPLFPWPPAAYTLPKYPASFSRLLNVLLLIFWAILQFHKVEAVACLLRKRYCLPLEKEATWTWRLRSIPDHSELERQDARV